VDVSDSCFDAKTLVNWLDAPFKSFGKSSGVLAGPEIAFRWGGREAAVPRSPAAVADRLHDSSDPLHQLALARSLTGIVDLQAVVRKAATAALEPDPEGLWALEGVIQARGPLTNEDPVLRRLLDRRADGVPTASDPREANLLAVHLRTLAESNQPWRWAVAIRTAAATLAHRTIQFKVPESRVVLDPRRFQSRKWVAGVTDLTLKTAKFDGPPLVEEARWLLACDHWRDGVRRAGGVLLVNPAAYLLVCRLLEREPFGFMLGELPELGAPKMAWIRAASTWIDAILAATDGRWVSYADPREVADGLRWSVAPDLPLITLRYDALVDAVRNGITPAVAEPTPKPRRGGPLTLNMTYLGAPLCVCSRGPKDRRTYMFESPFPVSVTFLEDSGLPLQNNRFRRLGRVFWSTTALEAMADAAIPGAPEFLDWALDAIQELGGGNFASQRRRQMHQVRVERRLRGEIKTMGALTPEERGDLAAFLDQRPVGPYEDADFSALVALLPGRSERGIRRALRHLLKERAKAVGWKAFRASGWWPGGDLSRSIFAAVKTAKRR